MASMVEILKRIFIWNNGIVHIYSWTIFAILTLVIGTIIAVIKSKKDNQKTISGFYPIFNLNKFWPLFFLFLFIGIIIGLAYTESNPFVYFQF